MCYVDDEYDYNAQSWRTARKAHECYACRLAIQPGHRYHVCVAGARGERPDTFKHCARCWAICEALWKAGAEYVQFDLDCGENWEENFGALPEHVAALAFMTADEAQQSLFRGAP
jgi:hypothetical protein